MSKKPEEKFNPKSFEAQEPYDFISPPNSFQRPQMKIECSGTISIVSSIKKAYWHKRPGYYVVGRFVKPKRIRKFKNVRLKKPHLHGDIRLIVDQALIINGIYADNNGFQYVCTTLTGSTSKLLIFNTNLGETFSPPQRLELVAQAFSEQGV